ncbi:MAG: MFS transporter [Minisyncoccia bacterium]
MKSITAVYLVTLFYAFHYALPLYSESSYLETLVPKFAVGIIYSIAALGSLALTLKIGGFLNRWSNRRVLISAAILEGISLFVLSYTTSLPVSVIFFILHTILLAVLYVGLNVLVESVSKKEDVGKIRGVYLTILNVGILTGPFFASQLVGSGFALLFLSAALCLIPMVYILYKNLDHLHEPRYIAPDFFESLKRLRKFENVRKIVFAQFILELFWIIMILYGPIYLKDNNIATLATYLGVVIPIILIPFILLPYPLGRLADHKLGEKELLVFGILLMIFGTGMFALLTTSSLAIYIFALFIARLGSSMVEEMSSSYFYKQVDHSQADLISIFVNTRNLAFISGPLIASVIIYYSSIQVVFFVLVGVLVLSLLPILKLHDTK